MQYYLANSTMSSHNLTLIAKDNYLSITQNFQLQVQQKVNFNVITNPTYTFALTNDGSNYFSKYIFHSH